MNTENKNIVNWERNCQSFSEIQQAGEYFISAGDYASAHDCFEKAAELNPDSAEPYVGLGLMELQKGNPDSAEIAFRVACRLEPKCDKAYSGLAAAAQKKGDYEKAFEMYLKCLELNINNMTALLGLFQTSCQMGSFAKVIHYLELYLKMQPDDCSVMFALAVLYVRENKFESAQKILTNILQLDPANEDAVNLLEEVEHNLTSK